MHLSYAFYLEMEFGMNIIPFVSWPPSVVYGQDSLKLLLRRQEMHTLLFTCSHKTHQTNGKKHANDSICERLEWRVESRERKML